MLVAGAVGSLLAKYPPGNPPGCQTLAAPIYAPMPPIRRMPNTAMPTLLRNRAVNACIPSSPYPLISAGIYYPQHSNTEITTRQEIARMVPAPDITELHNIDDLVILDLKRST